MGEYIKKNSNSAEPRDYKERFEFRLTVGNNIICQRYFKIGMFNPKSLSSMELMETIEHCAKSIDRELKDKTQVYLSYMAPRYFKDFDELNKYLETPENKETFILGEGIVINDALVDYFWNGEEAVPMKEKFDKGEFTNELSEEDWQTYKFAFYDNGREVCSSVWNGCYPKAIRNSIDLSNKRGRYDSDTSFEIHALYKACEGKVDMCYGLIKDICAVCSASDNDNYYTTYLTYKNGANGKASVYENLEWTKDGQMKKLMKLYSNKNESNRR